jgi:phosphatidylserine decarboxylase
MVMVMKADNAKIGYIAIVFIGMAEVSSCISKVNVNDKVKKGDLIGNFAFGGSSHLMVFQKDAKLKFNEGLYDQCNGTKSGLSQKLHSYLAHLDC